MARKRNYAAKKIQRAFRRRRRMRGNINRATMINTHSVIAPDSLLVKMPYATTVYTNATGTFGAVQNFRMNSINDPDYSGAGHQPMSHDEWAAFYERYTVYGCKLEMKFYAPTGDPVEIVYFPSSFVTTPTTLADAKEIKYSEALIVMPGEKPVVRTRYYDISKILGISRKDMSQSRYRTAFGSNPTDDVYHLVMSANIDGSSAINLKYNAKLTYYCKLDCVRMIDGS